MTTFEPSLVLPFRNSWYRGPARLTGRNVLINDLSSRAAQAVAVAYPREGAMVIIPVGVQEIAATGLCDLIVKEGGRASLLQGGTEQETKHEPSLRAALRVFRCSNKCRRRSESHLTTPTPQRARAPRRQG
jgi:hypothetical protein